MNVYQICEFGGNTVSVNADSPAEAVRMIVKDGVVEVFPDGYIHVNGEPFGWVRIEEQKAKTENDIMAEEIDYKALYEQAIKDKEHYQEQIQRMHRENQRNREREYNISEYRSRVKCLESMEFLMRNLNNGDFIDDWLMNGVPDDGTEQDYCDIASDPGLYSGAVNAFIRTMRRSVDSHDYFAFCHWGEKDSFGPNMREHKDIYKEDVYEHKLFADKYTVKVHIPGENATWRLKEDDIDKVLELLNTLEEVDESKEQEE